MALFLMGPSEYKIPNAATLKKGHQVIRLNEKFIAHENLILNARGNFSVALGDPALNPNNNRPIQEAQKTEDHFEMSVPAKTIFQFTYLEAQPIQDKEGKILQGIPLDEHQKQLGLSKDTVTEPFEVGWKVA